MSKTAPMKLERRLANYLGREVEETDREWDLTPAQRHRAWRKALRSGERKGTGRELLGCKGGPTPRRPRRGPVAPEIVAEAVSGG